MGCLGDCQPIRMGSKAANASPVEEVCIFTTPPPLLRELAPGMAFQIDLPLRGTHLECHSRRQWPCNWRGVTKTHTPSSCKASAAFGPLGIH